MSLRPNATLFDELMRFWRDEPDKLKVYDKAADNELVNPDQSLIISFARHHSWWNVGPLRSVVQCDKQFIFLFTKFCATVSSTT
jgi:hypothetical protein